MKNRSFLPTKLGIPIATLALLAAACGGDSVPLVGAADAPATDNAAAAAPAPAAAASATIGGSELGDVLVGTNGLTLYGFTNDVSAASTCSGTCADAWPPVIVDENFSVAPGLDVGIFATTVRDDGQLQLVAGKWPLYFFAGDTVPGDVNGQTSGDVWFVVAPDGSLVTEAVGESAAGDVSPSDAVVAQTGPVVSIDEGEVGPILIDGSGLSLYGFTEDVNGQPTCNEACADAWPPVIVATADLPVGLDPAVFSVVQRDDGQLQLSAGVWPLYRFAGDGAPGDVNGQGSGGVWFLATPEGGLINNGQAAPSNDGAVEAEAGETESDSDGY